MWLLKTDTISLQFFSDERKLVYAILSHRWLDDEVLFEDVRNQTAVSAAKAGWAKVRRACDKAREDGYQFIWIDTLSIDKSSSAELSEAINSMYRWYQNAAICYAYLADVRGGEHAVHDLPSSNWFTRGWTLQELIAPTRVEFLDHDWKSIGSREQLDDTLSTITGIPRDLLSGKSVLAEYSIAQRMAWAARRDTTRVEDHSYSLIGLFGVNMPLLYGEGERAFIRLQEEIIKTSADHSIFAWEWTKRSSNSNEDAFYRGLLAESPSQFVNCGSVVEALDGALPLSYQQTNIGLKISLEARIYDNDVFHVGLNCERPDAKGIKSRVGIFLGCNRESPSTEHVGRCLHAGLDALEVPSTASLTLQHFIVPRFPFPKQRPPHALFGFAISMFNVGYPGSAALRLNQGVYAVARPNTWDAESGILRLPFGMQGIAMGFAVRTDDRNPPLMIGRLGLNTQFCPWVLIDSGRRVAAPRTEADEQFVLTNGSVRDPRTRGVPVRSVEEVLNDTINPTMRGHDTFTGTRMQGLSIDSGEIKIEIKRRDTGSSELGLVWDVAVSILTVFQM